jgi:ELWxxDGT repeat protein
LKTKLLPHLIVFFVAGNLNAQTLLKDIETLPAGGSSNPRNWCAVTDDLFIFQATNILDLNYLFASDGTESGTIGLGAYLIDTDIIRLGNKAFFGGCNITTSADSCGSLYISDGTVDGTMFFFDLDQGGVSLGIEDIVAGDSLFYFSGHTINSGYELWRSNGTVEGTYRVMEIAEGETSGYNGELAVIDDIAYFAGYTEDLGIEAWRSDGSEEGTYMIYDLNEGSESGFPSGFTKSGGYIYFSGLGTGTGVEVRRTTGEEENIELIGEFGGTTDSSNPRDFVDSDGTLYYVAQGLGTAGYDLFSYNHVGDPTQIELSKFNIFPRALMPFGNGEVIFNAIDDDGRELWKSDGTVEGTIKIIDLYPGENDGVFGNGEVGEAFYMCMDSVVYFAGADGVNASGEFVYELFSSDGTASGTHLISDHVVGAEGSNPGNFFEFGNRIYFAATHTFIGREPYYLEKGNVTSLSELNSAALSLPKLYPNPINQGDLVTVDLTLKEGSDLQVQLYDLTGRSVAEVQNLGYFNKGNNHVQFSFSKQSSGFYLVEILGQGKRLNFPVFIK